ncbi:MAG: hypothetical protein EBY52_10485, partial [Actinobacteria bacterium]|nr:hypothetical protein [Actinomycetota bacterium]
MSRTRRRSPPWLVTAVGGDAIAYRDAFVALFVAVIASLVAGITLATTTDTLEELPGLLLLVPAALAVKGNIFGALGSRLGTSIHTGVFQLSPRLDTVVGQNTAAALILSLVVSVELALLAKGVAIVFNVSPTMSTVDFITVSAVGGAIASGVLSSRLATKVHLGLVRPGALPRGQAGSDIVMIFMLCIPIFAVAGVVAEFGGLITGQASPGLWQLIAVAVLGGLLASLAVVI